MRSCFSNCGQVCLGTERLYVERPVFEEFVDRLAAGARELRIGTPDDPDADMGPLISRGHRDKVLSYYAKALEEGAEIVTGGGIPDMPKRLENGAWIEPTIWTGLGDHAAVVQEEIFGPCVHVRPFDDEEEAIELANDTDYGLAATIATTDVRRAHRVSSKLEVGIVWVNEWFLRDLRTPFGGAKRSGIGREGGVHSLAFYTETKNVCVKL
jgi:aminomuconate-semialdehyde/2-hydroxymuconate-6-semialdehyde dehydrogenase